ncbi:MAG: oligopeptide/dipeptide ABC transporter ATP-binding protein [Candidatus Nanopelagicales bacterium]
MSLLEVSGLTKQYVLGQARPTVRGEKPRPLMVHAVEGVSFDLAKGEVLTIVGESGCGKSTIAKMLVGLVTPTAGTIRVDGRELGEERTQADRRLIQLVSQNPWSALNRRRNLRHALEQPLLAHHLGGSKAERTRLVESMVERVGLTNGHLAQRPAGVSGGELARAVLARALLLSPKVLVLDEPTASLDVSVKATVVNLLLDLREELGLSMLLITHEIDIARKLADRTAVMYLGRMVETGLSEAVLEQPHHPYSRMLLASMPVADPHARELPDVKGEVASAIAPPPGCAYHPRCPYVQDACARSIPLLRIHQDRMLACHRADEVSNPEFIAAHSARPTGVVPPHASARDVTDATLVDEMPPSTLASVAEAQPAEH